MSRRHLTPWILLASLVYGLWVAAAHDPQHAPAAHPDTCAVCAFATGAAGALPVLLCLLVFAPVRLVFRVGAIPAPRRVTRARVRVRGPPSILA